MPKVVPCKFPGSYEVLDDISSEVVGYVHIGQLDPLLGHRPDFFTLLAPAAFSRLTELVNQIDIVRARLDMIQVAVKMAQAMESERENG